MSRDTACASRSLRFTSLLYHRQPGLPWPCWDHARVLQASLQTHTRAAPGRRLHKREERSAVARKQPAAAALRTAAAHRRRCPAAGTRCRAQPLSMMAAPAAR